MRDHSDLTRRRFFALAGAGTAAACLPAPAAPAPKNAPALRGLFVLDDSAPEFRRKGAYYGRFTLVDESVQVKFRLDGLSNDLEIGSPHRIAMDRERGWVWVAESVGRRLLKYDLTGRELLKVPDVNRASAIAVDPTTGHLWVTTGDMLPGDKTIVFDPQGQQVAAHDVPGYDIVHDPKGGAFWTVSQKLHKLSPAGKVLFQAPISTWTAVSIDVHPSTGAVWVGAREHHQVANSREELIGFANDGTRRTTVNMGKTSPMRVAVDPSNGSVWVAAIDMSAAVDKRTLLRYSATGEREAVLPFPALAVAAGPRAGTAWVVTAEEILLIDADGKVHRRVRHDGKTSQAWVASF